MTPPTGSSLADEQPEPTPRIRERAVTGVIQARNRLASAHGELELSIQIFRELGPQGASPARLRSLEDALGVLEDAQRMLDEGSPVSSVRPAHHTGTTTAGRS